MFSPCSAKRRASDKDLPVLILLISTMVNGTVLNSGKKYKDDSRAVFDQLPNFYLGFDAEPEISILKVI